MNSDLIITRAAPIKHERKRGVCVCVCLCVLGNGKWKEGVMSGI